MGPVDPGTVGGFVRMNGGAYGEVKDILVEADIVLRSGERRTLPLDLGYTYRHSELPEGAVVVGATFRGRRVAEAIEAEMDASPASAVQPLRSKTGGSTFKNPTVQAWRLVDEAGCRFIGGAQVMKHTNF